MRRSLAFSLALILAAACSSGPGATTTASPAATKDIRQGVLDIAYTSMADSDVHKVSSKKLLVNAFDALKARAKQTGGSDDVSLTADLQDVSEPILADFKKFAAAVQELARKNPQLTPDQIAETAVTAFMRSSPDCHTYWRREGGTIASRPETAKGTAAMPPPNATPADEAGLRYALVADNIGYVTWREFRRTGTYDITTNVKKALDALLAQGAKAWIFDLRANQGGDPPQTMTSWFLNGEPIMKIEVKTGQAGTVEAKKELRLPNEFQLPIAVIVNDRGGSSPEVFTLGLKENKRAVVVGAKTVGCLGATFANPLPDKTELYVVLQEFVGAVTGTRYNNAGIPPDVPSDDVGAVTAATNVLKDLLSKGKLYP